MKVHKYTKKVIIFGTGSFGKIIYLYLKHDPLIDVMGFTANEWTINENKIFNLPVIPFEKIELAYPPSEFQMFIAVGYSDMNKKRSRFFDQAKSKGYELMSYVHPTTIVGDEFEIGENCFVFENNVMQPFVHLGNDVIIWTGNVISHHTIIKDHCFIVSHTSIAGNVIIEPHCFLGMNCTIRNNIKIGRECVIGAGAVILEDTQEKGVYTTCSTIKLDITSDVLKSL
jgi:sugar O-acyltransferase (sialic acid O-acetyltransferase NeuD family)